MKKESTDGGSKAKAKAGQTEKALFSKEEKAAMRAMVKERKAGNDKEAAAAAVLEAIAAMPSDGRAMAERLHAIITSSGPSLSPRTWYGMPAYANEEGKVVCFFRGKEKFKERYMTLGFNQEAKLDDGPMWPIAYALTDVDPATEREVEKLVKKAVG